MCDQPPEYITDPEQHKKAVASEMEHAIRSHVQQKLDEDPVYYGKLRELARANSYKLERE